MADLILSVYAWVLWLYWTYCPSANDPANLAHLLDVLALRDFAGARWHDASTGLAAWWAIVIDNLIDLIDPYPSVRGDH